MLLFVSLALLRVLSVSVLICLAIWCPEEARIKHPVIPESTRRFLSIFYFVTTLFSGNRIRILDLQNYIVILRPSVENLITVRLQKFIL